MDVRLVYFDGCPHWRVLDERLRALAVELGLEITHVLVGTSEQAREQGMRGSPTLLVEGRDPFAGGDEPAGLSCRLYETPGGLAGAPTIDQLREALSDTSRDAGAP